jgi:hypothetical protein
MKQLSCALFVEEAISNKILSSVAADLFVESTNGKTI